MVRIVTITVSLVARFSSVARSIRNVGIIAHIDAGKTTTTERILFNAGKIRFAGEVDKGTTVTDYLDQERERGISITSATATIKWNEHTINIIDTPGHVDFTLEVERALTVLDGSITIIDSTKGVQAQTLTVWNQATSHKIPNIFYINKFDRKQSNLNLCLKSIKNKLPNIIPLLIHLPYFSEDTSEFCGILDIIDLKLHKWCTSDKASTDEVSQVQSRKISDSEPLFKMCLDARLQLLESLADLEDGLIRHEFLMLDKPDILIPNKMIHDAIRNVTISTLASVVLIGSSRMNIGVNHLLDKVVAYLPNPSEKNLPSQFSNLAVHPDHLSALAFKVIHDSHHRGPLTFLRLYSGLLKPNSSLNNLTRSVTEKVDKILQMTGDHFMQLDVCSSGQIVAVSGLKHCYTGDVLVDVLMPSSSDEDAYKDLIPIPSPVVFTSIEPYSISEIKALNDALSELSKEDPSLSFHRDEDTNQLIIGGMGNLHLEVILDRIKRDYKLPRTKLGKLKIVYKECATEGVQWPVSHDHVWIGKIQGKDVTISMHLTATLGASHNEDSEVNFVNSKEFSWGVFPPKIFKIIQTSINKALHTGGVLLKGQLMGIKVAVHSFIVDPNNISFLNKSCHPILRSCVVEGARGLFHKIDTDLLEPLMSVEISFGLSGSSETQFYMSKVQNDLNKRRAHIISVDSSISGPYPDTIKAFIPLADTIDYSDTVRSLTSGQGTIHISFSHYGRMTKEAQEVVTTKKIYRY